MILRLGVTFASLYLGELKGSSYHEDHEALYLCVLFALIIRTGFHGERCASACANAQRGVCVFVPCKIPSSTCINSVYAFSAMCLGFALSIYICLPTLSHSVGIEAPEAARAHRSVLAYAQRRRVIAGTGTERRVLEEAWRA